MHPLVTCILPVRGRPEQTLVVAAALRQTAGNVPAEWWAVGGADDAASVTQVAGLGWRALWAPSPRLTYWQALALASDGGGTPILCCLANDLAPEQDWLANGLAAYAARFGEAGGLMGFAGDGHGPHHSCHFLIGRQFLADLGGWPTWYDHNFGDTELCERAQALGRYGKATRAILNHRHAGRGLAPNDTVYQEGARRWEQDKLTYQRRRAQWAS